VGILATGAALLAAGHAGGSPARSGGSSVTKSYCLHYVAFNNSRALFRGNAALRRAVNWAIDRRDYVVAEPNARAPWTHLLPPGAPGSITKSGLQPYGKRGNIARARRIAAGHFRDGRMTIYYATSATTGSARADNVRRDLISLGFDPANITMRGFDGVKLYEAAMKLGAGWDLAVSFVSCSEDPASFMRTPWPWWYPKNQKYARKVSAAMRLTGRARKRALGRLDLEIMRNVAPVAVMAFGDSR